MSGFQTTAQNIRVDEGHILRAQLQNEGGQFVDAEIDLNQFIGNDNGRLTWGSGGFSGSSQDVTFNLEGDVDVPILRANCANVDGQAVGSDLNLAERIINQNGTFVFLE